MNQENATIDFFEGSVLGRINFRNKIIAAATVFSFGYLTFTAVDLIQDSRIAINWTNVVSESGMAILLIFAAWKVAIFLIRKEADSAVKLNDLNLQNAEWKRRASESLAALNVQLNEQMNRWQLSRAEKQVARMLLRGYSNREIAHERKTSEHTVKQQISSIFRKSGLKSRMEISAFFLGDLNGDDGLESFEVALD